MTLPWYKNCLQGFFTVEEMETFYIKCDNSEQVNVLMEEQNRAEKSKGTMGEPVGRE